MIDPAAHPDLVSLFYRGFSKGFPGEPEWLQCFIRGHLYRRAVLAAIGSGAARHSITVGFSNVGTVDQPCVRHSGGHWNVAQGVSGGWHHAWNEHSRLAYCAALGQSPMFITKPTSFTEYLLSKDQK